MLIMFGNRLKRTNQEPEEGNFLEKGANDKIFYVCKSIRKLDCTVETEEK